MMKSSKRISEKEKTRCCCCCCWPPVLAFVVLINKRTNGRTGWLLQPWNNLGHEDAAAEAAAAAATMTWSARIEMNSHHSLRSFLGVFSFLFCSVSCAKRSLGLLEGPASQSAQPAAERPNRVFCCTKHRRSVLLLFARRQSQARRGHTTMKHPKWGARTWLQSKDGKEEAKAKEEASSLFLCLHFLLALLLAALVVLHHLTT